MHSVLEQPEHYATVELMIQKGVSLKHKNKAGHEPQDLALNAKAENWETYLMLAANAPFFSSFPRLL